MPVLPGWHLSPGVDELRDDGESCLTFELSRNMILVIQAESVGEKSGLAFVCTLKRTGDGGTWIIKYEIEAFGRSRRNGVGNAIFELPLEMAENETVAALFESPAGNLMGAVEFNRASGAGIEREKDALHSYAVRSESVARIGLCTPNPLIYFSTFNRQKA